MGKEIDEIWKEYGSVCRIFEGKQNLIHRLNLVNDYCVNLNNRGETNRWHSQIRNPWNSNNYYDLSTWIGEQLCMQMDFWQFCRNAYICIIPGKSTETHLHAWVFYNPCGHVLKSIKSRGQICPILLRKKGTLHMDWRTTMHTKWILENFPGIIRRSAFQEKC